MSGKGLSVRTDLMIQEYQESQPGTGVHAWDPRLKLALLVLAVALNVVLARLWLSVCLFLVALALIVWSRVPARLFMLFFLAPAWATLLVFLGFSIGFGATPVAQFGFLTVYREGMLLGLSAASRVASDMSWMALVFLTTGFTQILSALKWYRVPEILVESLGMAYRYAFLLIDEFYRMASAVRAKGGFKSGYDRLRSTGMILSQVLTRAYDRALAIQQAMISRGSLSASASGHKHAGEAATEAGSGTARPEHVLQPDFPNVTAPVLELRDVTFSYLRDGEPEIDGVSLRVDRGEILFLCGSNGSGKSTLLKLTAGILSPLEGSVSLSGVEIDRKLRNQAYRYVGLLFQDPDDQVFCPTVSEDVAFGPKNMGLSPEQVDGAVAKAMELTEIGHLAQRPIHRLSYGEMKRIGLAGLLAMRPPLLLLDEPRAFLDPAAAEQFIGLVRTLNRDLGYSFVIVTHDMDFAARLATRVIVLDRGHIVADGAAREILTDPEILAASRLQPPLLTRVFGSVQGTTMASSDVPLTAEEAIEMLAKKTPRD